jgi:hypothetical protein
MSGDLFNLDGKNLHRVAPQIHRQIALQRARVRAYIIVAVMLASLGGAWAFLGWIPTIIGIPCLLLMPFTILGIIADRHLLKFQRQRLDECECRLLQTADEG